VNEKMAGIPGVNLKIGYPISSSFSGYP